MIHKYQFDRVLGLREKSYEREHDVGYWRR